MQNITLAYVLDRITEKYGRKKASVKARLTGDLNEWIDQMCRRYNFWFLQQDPGLQMFNNLPTPSGDFTTLPPLVKGRWLDKGWLQAIQGQFSYLWAFPANEGWSTNPPLGGISTPPLLTSSEWTWGEIKKLLYVKEYDAYGVFLRDLPVLDYNEFLTHQHFDRQTRPDSVTFQTANGVSALHFAPTPDQTYLYVVAAQAASLPPLDKPFSTNAFLMYYPGTVVAAGLMMSAIYFHETQEIQFYSQQLYGAEYAQLMSTKATPGGMIGAMIADTKSRRDSGSEMLRSYNSSARALGRDNGRRRSRYPYYGYYGPL